MRKDVAIRNFLPHREPMLMVDKILKINDDSVETSFEISAGNILLDGEKLSAAGLIENCAQTCSTITGQNLFSEKSEKPAVIGFISNIKKVKVSVLPRIGETIITKAELLSEYQDICNIACRTFLRDEIILEAEIVMFVSRADDLKI